MKISDAAQLAPLLTQIRQIAAEAAAGGSPPQPTWSHFRLFTDTGDRLTYEGVYFRRRRALNALAVAATTAPGRGSSPRSTGRPSRKALTLPRSARNAHS